MTIFNDQSSSGIFNIHNKRSAYQGLLLGANPHNPKNRMSNSVILIVNQIGPAVIGLQLNNSIVDLRINDIIENLGFFSSINSSVYFGGNLSANKLHIVHSLDWSSLTTIVLNNQIGITSDISVLAAMTEGQGPEYFRACAGYWSWNQDLLVQQLNSLEFPDQEYKWEYTESTLDNVFGSSEEEQWQTVINEAVNRQSTKWLN